MREAKVYIKNITLCILALMALSGCTTEDNLINGSGSQHMSTNYGTVQLDFPIADRNLPQRCIKRIDLSIAYTADSLYRNEYITVANVSSYQKLYEFSLEPGDYYYKAGKVCLCGGDTCLWGGYPGGQNGTIWTMAKFVIHTGETTYDLLTFD